MQAVCFWSLGLRSRWGPLGTDVKTWHRFAFRPNTVLVGPSYYNNCTKQFWTVFTIMGLDRIYHAHQFIFSFAFFLFITSDKGGSRCVCPRSFVCLSVCLCMNLDEMLCVDRCRDMDELINFWARSGLLSGCWNRIAFSDIGCSATRNFITSGKPHICVLARPVAAARRGFKMVLFNASRGNTFVGLGGTCVLPSAF